MSPRLLVLALMLLAGTDASAVNLLPDTFGFDFEHQSHATQHAPIASSPTDYGMDLLEASAHWELPKGFFIELADGVSMNRKWCTGAGQTGYGETYGPREQFTFRGGYRWHLK